MAVLACGRAVNGGLWMQDANSVKHLCPGGGEGTDQEGFSKRESWEEKTGLRHGHCPIRSERWALNASDKAILAMSVEYSNK